MTDLPAPLISPLLAGCAGVRHGFFTRTGGVSHGLYASLNVGLGSRDEPDAVRTNRERAAVAFGRPPESLTTCYQIHSPDAVIAEAPWGDVRREADAVATAVPGVMCAALSADCAPVLLVDPRARVVAAAHAGWRGALAGVVQSTVARMVELGAVPDCIRAVVGPCIAPQSYEVGEDFRAAFEAGAPEAMACFGPALVEGKHLFDLPGFVLDRLRRAGVAQAEWIGRDTYVEEDLFFSNRRAVHRGEGDYGRLLSAIMLEP